jgi:hypothetical protein
VIDTELGKEDHGSIIATTIGRGLEPLMPELTPNQIMQFSRLNTGGEKKKKKLTNNICSFRF